MLYEIKSLTLIRGQEAEYTLSIPNLCIEKGEHIAITGRSGCGKSTCLDLLGMILAPNSIETFNFYPNNNVQDITKYWKEKNFDYMTMLRRKYLRYILQTGELLPYLTVEENIILSAKLGGIDDITARNKAKELAEILNITKLQKTKPTTLSIGERQRTAIARALASSPEVVLADEPTAALDPEHAQTVMKLFLQAIKAFGTTVIMVSHDISLVHEFNFREIQMQTETINDKTIATLNDINAH